MEPLYSMLTEFYKRLFNGVIDFVFGSKMNIFTDWSKYDVLLSSCLVIFTNVLQMERITLQRAKQVSYGHEYSVRIEIYQFCTSEVCEQYFAIFIQSVISFQQIIGKS